MQLLLLPKANKWKTKKIVLAKFFQTFHIKNIVYFSILSKEFHWSSLYFVSQYDNYMTAVPIEVIFQELFDWGKANCNCNFNFYFHHNFLSFVYFLSITCVFSIFPFIVFLTAMLMNLFSKIIHCQLSIIF